MDPSTEQQKLNEVTRRSREKAQLESDRISREVAQRRAKIEKLQDERQRITNGPVSNSEALESAKEGLKRNRSKYFDLILKKILEDNRRSRTDSFGAVAMRLHVASDMKLSGLILGCITEADLERAAKQWEGGEGPTAKQRHKKIQAIDAEVKQLESEIEEILK